MSTYRRIYRDVLRRKVGNKALSKAYKKLNAKQLRKRKGIIRRLVDKFKRWLHARRRK